MTIFLKSAKSMVLLIEGINILESSHVSEDTQSKLCSDVDWTSYSFLKIYRASQQYMSVEVYFHENLGIQKGRHLDGTHGNRKNYSYVPSMHAQ